MLPSEIKSNATEAILCNIALSVGLSQESIKEAMAIVDKFYASNTVSYETADLI